MNDGPLDGYTVGVTGDRRADEQTELLQRRGAAVVHGPTIETRNLADSVELREATQALIDTPPEVLVTTTGVGVRSWFEAADGLGLGDGLRASLTGTQVLARSPKAAGALTTAGIPVDWQAPSEQTPELVERLATDDLEGVRVAVQRDGRPEPELADALAGLGADVVDVPIYRWTLPTDPQPAFRLIDALCDRQLDAITFTSAPAFANLLELASREGQSERVVAALRERVVVACVGPVCAEEARAVGVRTVVQPERWRLGSMVKALADELGGRAQALCVDGIEVLIRGGRVDVDGVAVRLPRREQLLLAALLDRPGAVVSKADLVNGAWEPGTDPHVVEVTVGRLRQRLGAAGALIETVPRRGYRLAA